MTKYILHGGETKIDCESNTNFFKEFLAGEKILLCYFASEKDKWSDKFGIDMNRIQSYDKTMHIDFMMAEPDSFIEQIEWADIVYFHGGDTELLKEILKPFNNLELIFKDKIIIGSSAGAYILSRHYYDQRLDKIKQGFGILPIKTICHYNNNIKEKSGELKNYKEDLELVALAETEFIIKEIE